MPRRRWLTGSVFVVVFVVHALNYAYFFVDDEAIPFVYAQNLLDGHGLVYNPDDGPVEGYSDFLSVWIDTAILGIVTGAGGSKLWAIAVAKLFAFVGGVVLVVVTFAILTRRSSAQSLPLVAGMTFLTLAGPLAVWSWSALETTLFALIVAGHRKKPAPGMLLELVAHFGAAAEDTLFVGDSDADRLAAAAAGVAYADSRSFFGSVSGRGHG